MGSAAVARGRVNEKKKKRKGKKGRVVFFFFIFLLLLFFFIVNLSFLLADHFKKPEMRTLGCFVTSNFNTQAIECRCRVLSPSTNSSRARITKEKASNRDAIGRRLERTSASTLSSTRTTRRTTTSTSTSTSALFFSRPTDPGDWDLSPEWYGTQGGGYGRDDGAVVYRSGDVVVTAHAASPSPSSSSSGGGGGEEESEGEEQWRVLRFGDATRQSVCRVKRGGARGGFAMDPTCLAFEYTKTLVALSLALLPPPSSAGGGNGDDDGDDGNNRSTAPRRPPRILCVGVGGGSVPAALAALRPDARVSAFELDDRVVGAWPAMGLSALVEEGEHTLRNLSLRRGCGAEAVAAVARSEPSSIDLLIVDAFDSQDRVPRVFTAADSPFFRDAASALAPRGSALINLHCGPRPGPAAALAALFSFKDTGGSSSSPSSSPLSSTAFDASRGEGKEAVDVTRTYAKNLLNFDHADAADVGAAAAFVVAARRQQNVAGVVTRGGLLALPPGARAQGIDASTLAAAAAAGASACAVPLPFDVGSRANFGLVKL